MDAFPETTLWTLSQASFIVSASDLDIVSGFTTYFIKYKYNEVSSGMIRMSVLALQQTACII